MGPDKMQLQRRELKYIITEKAAVCLRDFISSYLELDEFGAGKPGLSYPVHSLYLDSSDLRLYWDTINGSRNRFKLRLRFYDSQPETPVYFEIKRRVNESILKQRGGVRRDCVAWLLAGHLPAPSQLTTSEPKHLVALQHFCQRMLVLQATPRVHIHYWREAWVSPNNNSVRVTFDRQIRADLHFSTEITTEMRQARLASFGQAVILELKFTERYPVWFEDMVATFNLELTGAAKYIEGVGVLGESHCYGTGRPGAEPVVAAEAGGRRSGGTEAVLPKEYERLVYSR